MGQLGREGERKGREGKGRGGEGGREETSDSHTRTQQATGFRNKGWGSGFGVAVAVTLQGLGL